MMFTREKQIKILRFILMLFFLIEASSYASNNRMPAQHPPVNMQNNMHFHENQHDNHRQSEHHRYRNNDVYSPFYEIYPVFDSNYYYYYEAAPASVENSSVSNEENPQESDNNAYPNGNWVTASNGDVPDNAIVYSNHNGKTLYYCRGNYQGQIYYGQLAPNEGCYVQDQTVTIRFNVYEVLVAN